MPDRFPLEGSSKALWGKRPEPTLVAVHLLIHHALADQADRTCRDLRKDLVRILGVDVRTINRHLRTLREAGAIVPHDGDRISLADLSIPTSSTGIVGSQSGIVGSQSGIVGSQSGIVGSQIPRAVVKQFEHKQELALQALPGAYARQVETLLAACERYVPCDEAGFACSGRRIGRDTPGAGDAAESVLLAEGAASDPDGALAICVRYVEAYAAICRSDARQREFWCLRMLSTERRRRDSAWNVVKSAVDRAALAAVKLPTSGAVRTTYGSKSAEI